MAAAAILDLCTMSILMVNLSVGPHFQPMFQIQCKCMQQWPSYGQICDFQYGGRRHRGFCEIRDLTLKVVRGPYFRCLCQIWCKAVQKWRSCGRFSVFKMAAAAILNCYFVTVDHPRSLLHGPNIVLKFHVNRFTTVGDMAIWKFCKFGLKRLFPPPKCTFLGVLPLNIIFRHRDPQKALPCRNRILWAIKHRDRSRGLIGTASEEYKKTLKNGQRVAQMRWQTGCRPRPHP